MKNIAMDDYVGIQVIKMITGQEWKENCYLIIDRRTNEAVVIDPGYDSDEIITIIEKQQYKLKYILATHAHHDHIAGVQRLSEHFSVACILHPADKRVFMHSPMYSMRFAKRQLIRPQNMEWMDEAVLKELTKWNISILHTPGHSHGGVCIFLKNMVFTGDTLLKNYLGRTDLPEGNKTLILHSIEELFHTCQENCSVILYPGHGENWTLQEAKKWWDNQNLANIAELKMF